MKKLLISIVCLSAIFITSAQQLKYARVGVVTNGDNVELLQARTTLAIDLVIEKEVITSGQYARYSQKLLNLRAPLLDQTNYKIVGSNISVYSDDVEYNALNLDSSKELDKSIKLPINQTNNMTISPEYSAKDAAREIYAIRRQRKELVTGEAGEGYFGAGMQAAIDRLDQMEREYLELFVGQNRVVREVKTVFVDVDPKKKQYVVCRFDDKRGVVSDSDLSANPIYLQIIPSETIDTKEFEAPENAKLSRVMNVRVAAPSNCILYDNTLEINNVSLPIYEFGRTIKVECR